MPERWSNENHQIQCKFLSANGMIRPSAAGRHLANLACKLIELLSLHGRDGSNISFDERFYPE